MNYMSTKTIPLDLYSKNISNDIIFLTYNSYFIDQNNDQSCFLKLLTRLLNWSGGSALLAGMYIFIKIYYPAMKSTKTTLQNFRYRSWLSVLLDGSWFLVSTLRVVEAPKHLWSNILVDSINFVISNGKKIILLALLKCISACCGENFQPLHSSSCTCYTYYSISSEWFF
jgi:hypothetical protein